MSAIRSALQAFTNPVWIAERGLRREIGAIVRRLLPTRDHVWIDVGCGERPYGALFSGTNIFGFDVDVSGRPGAMKNQDVTYDGERLPVKTGSVDGILCTQVLEHVACPERFVSELARVLRPGGSMVLSVPLFWQEHEVPYDFYRYTSYGLKLLLSRHGFEVVDLRKSSGAIEALAQGASVYAFENLHVSIRGFSRLVAFLICCPIQLLGVLLQKLLPDRRDLYLDLVVCARRINPKSGADRKWR